MNPRETELSETNKKLFLNDLERLGYTDVLVEVPIDTIPELPKKLNPNPSPRAIYFSNKQQARALSGPTRFSLRDRVMMLLGRNN